jgi:hypothetical protein
MADCILCYAATHLVNLVTGGGPDSKVRPSAGATAAARRCWLPPPLPRPTPSPASRSPRTPSPAHCPGPSPSWRHCAATPARPTSSCCWRTSTRAPTAGRSRGCALRCCGHGEGGAASRGAQDLKAPNGPPLHRPPPPAHPGPTPPHPNLNPPPHAPPQPTPQVHSRAGHGRGGGRLDGRGRGRGGGAAAGGGGRGHGAAGGGLGLCERRAGGRAGRGGAGGAGRAGRGLPAPVMHQHRRGSSSQHQFFPGAQCLFQPWFAPASHRTALRDQRRRPRRAVSAPPATAGLRPCCCLAPTRAPPGSPARPSAPAALLLSSGRRPPRPPPACPRTPLRRARRPTAAARSPLSTNPNIPPGPGRGCGAAAAQPPQAGDGGP